MNNAAQVRHLTITFDGKPIVNDVSLDIPSHQISVLVGRSGSGKTTFLRAFNRLNEEHSGCQTTGELSLDLGNGLENQSDIFSGSVTALRLRVGMLFQTPNVLPVSIWRNIAMPLEKLTSLSREAISQRVEKSLNDVGLWSEIRDRLHSPATRLSGGQQQRLCLARVLALEPKILLLDEPTASLDVLASKHIEQLLQQLADRYTIIMVSHSLSQACRLANRLFVFDSGNMVKSLNEPDEITEKKLTALIEPQV
ncbi:phosphate ABC transporter ATP-binding protein [Budviciaceae bacterium BWR-B9]|uniref:Phosphate ABC transporter ATP-binding protein n=1 Tax=Limnobaculum allomyrinae TaxID=2791986 RepID=A0ABS1IKR5_9GAMM|nr:MULTISPECIES: phosphate ABC transporter ATP-binding protein [Limnobaculum]MBK5142334.1 phosphate ABC transporter ATP-binding protein [Limnobaculum allomyrinae]MBV7690781.1 phosphate ABC transporter ATP-binding protein [Limnobaculum sp. M2-1]